MAGPRSDCRALLRLVQQGARQVLLPAVRRAAPQVWFAASLRLQAVWPMARAELRRRAAVCALEASLAQRSARAEQRSAIPAAAGQAAFAARLPRAESEAVVAPAPDAFRDAFEELLDALEVRPPGELREEASASDGLAGRLQVAAVALAESDAQVQPAAPDAEEAEQPEAAAV